MNIHTVAANLRNTIAGKEKMLADYQEARKLASRDEDAALYATVSFLKVNIAELQRILADVEACCEQANLDSWTRNPDRSGGQFTEEEINRGSEWR